MVRVVLGVGSKYYLSIYLSNNCEKILSHLVPSAVLVWKLLKCADNYFNLNFRFGYFKFL